MGSLVSNFCPTDALKKYLHKFIARTLEEEFAEIEFYLITRDELPQGSWKKVDASSEDQ